MVLGRNMVTLYGTLDISGYYTDVSWKANEPEQERIDLGSRASYSVGRREHDDGLRGWAGMTGTIKILYEAGGGSPAEALPLGDTNSLRVYPDGYGALMPRWVFPGVRIDSVTHDGTFNGKLAYTVNWHGTEPPTFPDLGNGAIVLTAWDGNLTDYTEIYPRLAALGWVCTVGQMTDYIGQSQRCTAAQLQELSDQGWDIVVHSEDPAFDYGDPNGHAGLPWTEGALITSMTNAQNALIALGVSGSNVIAPSGGLYDVSWGVAQTIYDYIIHDDIGGMSRFPLPLVYTYDWQSCADRTHWSEVKAALDQITGVPEQVVVCSLHRIVAVDTTYLQLTNNSGASYVNLSPEVNDQDPDTGAAIGNLDTLAHGDWLVIGNSDSKFRGFTVEMETDEFNTNAATMAVEYWTGSAWAAVSNLIDETESGGKTLAQRGQVYWDAQVFPKVTLGGISAYWVRVSVSAQLSKPVTITEVTSAIGTQVSRKRLDKLLAYIDGLNCRHMTINDLAEFGA